MEASLFAVADSLDAITTDRPYHKAESWERARLEIAAGSGGQFDPAAVEAFSKVPDDEWTRIWRESLGNQPDAILPEFPWRVLRDAC